MPMPASIAKVRELKSEGASLYLWSTGAADYARASAIELGLADCFVGCLPKPDLYVDDQPVHEWRNCRHAYPGGDWGTGVKW